MFNFHSNHKALYTTSALVFACLSFGIAIVPATQLSESTSPLPSQQKLTDSERKGLNVFISEGCVACHTQQVRNIEMDNVWGDRPSIPSDYFFSKSRLNVWQQSPSLLGSERTGPDLTNVALRQPGEVWHFIHLYNPRAVEQYSIMPAYPWLFEEKSNPSQSDVIISLPREFQPKSGNKIVATEDAKNLVAYLLSLKQTKLPGAAPIFIQNETNGTQESTIPQVDSPDGAQLYASTCAPCHQQGGEGIGGAFPPLKGSPIVNNSDPELMIRIVISGYDARSEFGVMPPFGERLTNPQIVAIINHERQSWGNQANKVTLEKVESIRKLIENETVQ